VEKRDQANNKANRNPRRLAQKLKQKEKEEKQYYLPGERGIRGKSIGRGWD